jgi:hypothetical protein
VQTFDCFVERQIFPPVNKCIYCGDESGPFSDEHVIPYGLNGEMILRKSSCEKCSDITKKIEQKVLRTMLGSTRVHLGLRTRRPKERPQSLSAFVETNGGFERKDVSIQDHPHIMTMIVLPPPKVLNRSGGEKQGGIRIWVRDIQGNTNQRVSRLGQGAEIRNVIPIHEFGRVIAKIAHAYAASLLGIESFNPLLLDFILGKKENVFDFVGGPDEITDFKREKKFLHQVDILTLSNPDRTDLLPLVIVNICLFSCLDAPIYQAVVGSLTAKGLRLLKSK